MFEIAV